MNEDDLSLLKARDGEDALYENGVEIPSDYSGVVFVPFDDKGGW